MTRPLPSVVPCFHNESARARANISSKRDSFHRQFLPRTPLHAATKQCLSAAEGVREDVESSLKASSDFRRSPGTPATPGNPHAAVIYTAWKLHAPLKRGRSSGGKRWARVCSSIGRDAGKREREREGGKLFGEVAGRIFSVFPRRIVPEIRGCTCGAIALGAFLPPHVLPPPRSTCRLGKQRGVHSRGIRSFGCPLSRQTDDTAEPKRNRGGATMATRLGAKEAS